MLVEIKFNPYFALSRQGKSIYTGLGKFFCEKMTLGKLRKSGNIPRWHFNKFIGQAA